MDFFFLWLKKKGIKGLVQIDKLVSIQKQIPNLLGIEESVRVEMEENIKETEMK